MQKITRAVGPTGLVNTRQKFVGLGELVPLLDGSRRPSINFDNAASTPVLAAVQKTVDEFLPWYSSVHRGSGFKSLLSSKAYEDARQTVAKFFGANRRDHVVIFGKNSTEAINKLSYRLNLNKHDIVLVGLSEHHSNDLPWRAKASVRHIGLDGTGNLDIADYKNLLAKYKGRVKLVAISGGSNVTGLVPDMHGLARLAHSVGAQILVDCAQLAAHRAINLRPLSDPTHLDYIAASAHKMYAPFGSGALIGRRDSFEVGAPEVCGGGTIKLVTEKDVEWAATPDRDEAGSPNVIGAVAFARALQILSAIGMDKIAKHEIELTTYALQKLSKLDGLMVYGDSRPDSAASRLGVISLNIHGKSHALVAAILSAEWGIAVRSGCFCAQPYVIKLLNVKGADFNKFKDEAIHDDRRSLPGMVRISFGMYNNRAEVDTLVQALEAIAAGDYRGQYVCDKLTGQYWPRNWQPDPSHYFSL